MFNHSAIIETNVQNGIPFHGHNPRDVVSIRQLPHRQLSVVCQIRPHSDAAAQLVFQKSFKVIFVYLVANCFMDLLASYLSCGAPVPTKFLIRKCQEWPI